MKVKITLSYDGSRFYGFQEQNSGVKTVANEIKYALNRLGIELNFNASGRTDRGVHATYQVIDLLLPNYWSDLKRFQSYLNRQLYPYIHIKSIKRVEESFHARFHAKSRLYRYLIYRGGFSPFLSDYALFKESLNIDLLNKAAKIFEGEHDFKEFYKLGSDEKSTVRRIKRSFFYTYRDFYIYSVEADGFLRSQIRMMLSFLLKIDDGKLSIDELKDQLELKRVYTKELVEPNGLYLSFVKY